MTSKVKTCRVEPSACNRGRVAESEGSYRKVSSDVDEVVIVKPGKVAALRAWEDMIKTIIAVNMCCM